MTDVSRGANALLLALALSACTAGEPAFLELPDGRIASHARIELDNESSETRHYSITLYGSSDASLRTSTLVFAVEARGSMDVPLVVEASRETFVAGKRRVTLRVGDDRGFARVVPVTLVGPGPKGH